MKIDLLIKCVKELGYHLGTILGTIWVPLDILGTTGVPFWVPLCRIFVLYKNRFLKFSTFIGTLWVPNGTQSGTTMVPKICSLKSMKSQLSKTVSNVIVRCLDPSLPLVEIM